MKRFSDMKLDWIEEKDKLKKNFLFDDFDTSIEFVNKVALISNKLNHHPTIKINYNKVEIKTTTHDE